MPGGGYSVCRDTLEVPLSLKSAPASPASGRSALAFAVAQVEAVLRNLNTGWSFGRVCVSVLPNEQSSLELMLFERLTLI